MPKVKTSFPRLMILRQIMGRGKGGGAVAPHCGQVDRAFAFMFLFVSVTPLFVLVSWATFQMYSLGTASDLSATMAKARPQRTENSEGKSQVP